MILRLFSIILLLIYISLQYLYQIDIVGMHYFRNFTFFILLFSFIHPLLFKNTFLKKAYKINIYEYIQDEKLLPKDIDVELWTIKKTNLSAFSFKVRNTSHIILNERYLNELSQQEVKFIILHELHHVLRNDVEKNIISWAVVIALIPFVTLNMNFLYNLNFVVSIPLLLTIYALSVATHFFFSRKREFNADKFSRNYTSSMTGKATLDKIEKMEGVKESGFSLYHTHPTIKKRKYRLNN